MHFIYAPLPKLIAFQFGGWPGLAHYPSRLKITLVSIFGHFSPRSTLHFKSIHNEVLLFIPASSVSIHPPKHVPAHLSLAKYRSLLSVGAFPS